MIPYIVVIIFSFLLTMLAESYFKKNDNKKGIIILIFVALFISIFSGLRTVNIGWDTKVYGYPWFIRLSDADFSKFKFYLETATTEKGFLVYCYFLLKIFNNLNFMLWGLQFFVSLCFIYFLYNFRNRVQPSLMMMYYLCTLYIVSFSTLRQCLSIGLAMVVIVLLDKKKYLFALIVMLLSFCFHNSAIFSIVIPLAYFFEKNVKLNPKIKTTVFILAVLFIIPIIIGYDKIIPILYKFNIITSKYMDYTMSTSNYSKGRFRPIVFAFKSIVLFFSFLLYKKNNKSDKKCNEKFWLLFLTIDYLLMFMTVKITNIHRVTYYIYYPSLFILGPQIKSIFKINNYKDTIIADLITIIIPFSFFLLNLITDYYQMRPYQWVL